MPAPSRPILMVPGPGLGNLPSGPGPAPNPSVLKMELGAYQDLLASDNVTVFERYNRAAPEASMYNARLSPARPFTFNIIRYEVEPSESVIITDFEFFAGRFSGASAGSSVPLEPGAMGTFWGFDINVNGEGRIRDTLFQIDPVPIASTRAASQAVEINSHRFPSVERFAASRANSFGVGAGGGTSTMPFGIGRYGPSGGPITMWVGSGQQINAVCTIARPLTVPLSYVGAKICGYKVPFNIMAQIRKAAAI